MTKEKLSKKELGRYLGLKKNKWQNISSKRAFKLIEIAAGRMMELEEYFAFLRETFSLIRELRLNRTFDLCENSVDQLRIVFAEQIISDRVQYSVISNSLNAIKQQLKVLIDQLKIEENKTALRVQNAVNKYLSKMNKSSVVKNPSFNDLRSIYAEEKGYFLTVWHKIGDSIVNSWKKILIKNSVQLDALTKQLIRVIPGNEPEEVNIPVDIKAGFTLEDKAITEITVRPNNLGRVTTVDGKMVEGSLNDLLPRDLLRLINPTLKLFNGEQCRSATDKSFIDLEREVNDEAVDDHTVNEVLRIKQRLLGFNPKEVENTRLMFEPYLKNPLHNIAITPDTSTSRKLSPYTISDQLKDTYRIIYNPKDINHNLSRRK